MSSSQKAKIAFALALLLLGLSCIAAGFVILRLYRAETLVRHTYEVEVAIGDLESALTDVGRTRVEYVNSGTPESLKVFSEAEKNVEPALARIRQLIRDNPEQLALCDRLESNANQRVAASHASVELKQQSKSDPQNQLQFTLEVAKTAFDTAIITQQMKRNEDALLGRRSRLSSVLFTTIQGILAVSFLLSAVMFWLHYRLLNRELRERMGTANQLRQLSLQLMRVQDEEHRRFARELHDGLGQALAGAKMMVDALCNGNSGDSRIAELAAVLSDALSQTRTISHLFHPPFLEEIGFASAATWLVEGYAHRNGVEASVYIPEMRKRLPRSLELTLYRVLQEALSNIHRHSRSAKAEITVETNAEWVSLRVRDYGRGIPREILAAIRANGMQDGVGLTGMKERVREQGGTLEIRSDENGTEITTRIPLSGHIESPNSTPAASVL